jgi:GTPase-activating protein BEM2
MNRKAFERLSSIEREVNLFQFDHRGIRDEAQREAMQTNAATSAKKVARPFYKLVASQIEKNRRDKNLRDRLIKERRLEESRNFRREDLFNKAMQPRKTGEISQKQRRNKKSMSLAFMHFMRPISSAFVSENLHPPGMKRSPSELDFAPSGKPSLVLSLVEARVAQFINNERSFTFQLDTEDGGHYLLQAVDKKDMLKWMDTISRVGNMATKRRLTYLENSPKPQPSDHIHNHPTTASRDPTSGTFFEIFFEIKCSY